MPKIATKAEKQYPLPVGMQEFEVWSTRIIEKTGPIADKESMQFVLANNIMHAPPDLDYYPDSYFIKRLRKTAANQIAGNMFNIIKTKQDEEKKIAQKAQAELQNQQSVAATTTDVATDVPKQVG